MTSPAQDGPVLVARDLAKAFGGVQAVAGMGLALRGGAITGLIGPNGAGKSTLFNLISGVLPPDAGSVELFGRDITGLPPHRIASLGLTRTFQLSRELGRLTVIENLMLAAPRQRGERLWRALTARVAIRRDEAALARRAREVLDLVSLGRLGDELAANISGGQKKLLELGRALMTDCPLILLDEPGAGVNPALMSTLMDAIARLNRDLGRTFLIVEHDMELIGRLCDPVIVMTEGRLLTQGRFEEVRRERAVVEAYLGSKA